MRKYLAMLAFLTTGWPAPLPAQPQVAVPGFLPSLSALHFVNNFENVPHFTINVAGVEVPIGDAANGMCGGMVFASRDYFESGFLVPATTVSPNGGALFDYLVVRLYDSFELPAGPFRYMDLMDPDLPDGETDLSREGEAPHGRAWVMIREEFPLIRSDLDSGVLSPIGLIRIKSDDPLQLGRNHQVLAYGYSLDGDDLQIFVYDPNHPDNDNVTIALNVSDPEHTTVVHYLVDGSENTSERMNCFFRTGYTYKTPPPGAIHVDLRNDCLFPDGQVSCTGFGGPFPTIAKGVAAAEGRIVLIRGGAYSESLTIDRACTLRTYRGSRVLVGE